MTSEESNLFGGEPYLQISLPDYEEARKWLSIKLAAALFFWFLVVPFVMMDEEEEDEEKKGKSKKNGTSRRTVGKTDTEERSLFRVVLLGSFVTVTYLLLSGSPNNSFASRGVFQAPLLSPEECQYVLSFSDAAAARNHEAALAIADSDANKSIQALKEEPFGWQKTRHGSYPTTDLNLVTDPFTKQDQAWLQDILNRRLAPTLSRIYGIPEASIRANDMFVVRYDAGHRERLDNHTDNGDVSINILLNDDFEGGGTLFWHRIQQRPFAHVQPNNVGNVLISSARLNHEGVPITKGTRIILVGFLSVDRMDPFTRVSTGLSWYASWLSLPWMTVRFKNGCNAARHRSADGGTPSSFLFRILGNVLEVTGDAFTKHHHSTLVDDRNATKYLEALDAAPRNDKLHNASWFRGQQISLTFGGSLDEEWEWRKQHKSKFEEL